MNIDFRCDRSSHLGGQHDIARKRSVGMVSEEILVVFFQSIRSLELYLNYKKKKSPIIPQHYIYDR